MAEERNVQPWFFFLTLIIYIFFLNPKKKSGSRYRNQLSESQIHALMSSLEALQIFKFWSKLTRLIILSFFFKHVGWWGSTFLQVKKNKTGDAIPLIQTQLPWSFRKKMRTQRGLNLTIQNQVAEEIKLGYLKKPPRVKSCFV